MDLSTRLILELKKNSDNYEFNAKYPHPALVRRFIFERKRKPFLSKKKKWSRGIQTFEFS